MEKQLIRISKQFTKGILGKRSSRKMCYAVCFPLQSFLRIAGFNTKLVRGEIFIDSEPWEHFWLELPNGKIIDPTADQFPDPKGEKMEKIFVGERPEWYKALSA